MKKIIVITLIVLLAVTPFTGNRCRTGLPETARMKNSGYFNPIHRTVINLAPADFQQSRNL